MKVTIVSPWNMQFLEKDFPGVHNKIIAQYKAFQDAGLSCHILDSQQVNGFRQKLLLRIPFASDGIKWGELIDPCSCNCLYIRRPDFISADMIRSLKWAKKENPALKILMEIPTYPYKQEYMNARRFPLLLKDTLHREKLCDCIDKIVDLSGHEKIFSISTLNITNGVDLSQLSPRTSTKKLSTDFNVMCAAAFAKWHGVDRFLSGLHIYLRNGGSRIVRLHLLGAGPAIESLKKQVEDYALQDYVVFYGQCNRAQMDEVYDRCRFAIDCLGCHRKGLSLVSSLKSREYLAKGMPFVYSGEIDVFQKDPVDFCLRTPSDESPTDIKRLLEFADRLYETESEAALISRIRKYAESHIGMDIAMKSVIDYIKESCHDGQ